MNCLQRQDLEPTQHVVIADLGEKNLKLLKPGQEENTFPFSFSKRPISCEENSLGTPWGLHEVTEKYGEGEPAGMVFEGRKAIGKCWHELPDTSPEQPCSVTTRILRLKGLEDGLNSGPGVDSYNRYIYIHGTNHPDKFPMNISAGCLVMLDEALIQLYDQVPVGTHVMIIK